MSYRDWGRGEGNPRERQPIAPWDDPGESLPDPYASGTERYRTPSRRRAIERGQQEPIDAYLPRWAVESGIETADGGGRHAAPDDEDDRPRSGGGWPAADSAAGRRGESGWRETPAVGAAPASEHTSEWTIDRPQEQGYVGSRRADSSEDDPVSGVVPQVRPRRSPSRRPEVIWSGGEESATQPEESDRGDIGRPTRRSRRATADSWPQPATDPPDRGAERPADPWDRSAERPADPWDRTAERPADPWDRSAERPADPWDRGPERAADPDLSYQAAVDPWDASGVHAWHRSAGTTRWDQPDGTGRWDQTDNTGQWDRFTDTGQWDRFTEATQWDRGEPAPSSSAGGRPWSDQPEGFWSGTRLAGDDPRWMDPPDSAPRSPVVSYTAPRPRTVPRQRTEPDRSAAPVSFRQRIEAAGAGAWSRRLEDDLLDPDPGGPFRPLIYTAACYLLPALVVFLWLLTLDGQAPPGCVTDISGGGCDSPRSHAFGSLIAGAPRFGLALAGSLLVAVLLRRVGTTWRSATVALAAAVVGGGLSTVLISAVTGQPIG